MPGPDDDLRSREPPGLLDSFRSAAYTAVRLLQTRVELLATELEEEVQRAVRLALLAAIAGFFAGLFVLMLALTIVIVFWDEHRVLAAVAMTGLFGVVVAGALLGLRRIARSRPRLLAATRDELRRDRESFESRLRGDGDEPAT
jgi:uncharacterized membrane protein YqjE